MITLPGFLQHSRICGGYDVRFIVQFNGAGNSDVPECVSTSVFLPIADKPSENLFLVSLGI